MEEKKTKEIVKVVVLSLVMLMLAISMIFTRQISHAIYLCLSKMNIETGNNYLVVHYIDVGQGDAIAIKFPNDKIMLIDAGPKSSQNVLVDYIKTNVLKSNNTLTIDYLLLSHPDIDHSGGISAVLGEFEVKNFFRPNIASDSENKYLFYGTFSLDEYDEAIRIANQKESLSITRVDKYIEFEVGEALVQIFPPARVYDSINSMSSVTKISYKGKSFLFAGDIQEDAEQDVINIYGKMLDCDVLKVAHHGSDTSTSEAFINLVTPHYAVISVGQNTYGHPSFSIISALENAGVKVITTKTGSIRIISENNIKLLESNDVYATEYINWWIIALVTIVFLAVNLAVLVIKNIKRAKNEL